MVYVYNDAVPFFGIEFLTSILSFETNISRKKEVQVVQVLAICRLTAKK